MSGLFAPMRRNGALTRPVCLMAASLSASTLASVACAQIKPTGLRCEYKVNPTAVDAKHPRLFWRIESPIRGQRQTAYRILVASSPDLLAKDQGDLWDTGQVSSGNTIQIPYQGKDLPSAQKVYWKVKTWGSNGENGWSGVSNWTVGLLSASDWKAQWIDYPSAVSMDAAVKIDNAKWIWHSADGANAPIGIRKFTGKLDIPAGATITSAKLLMTADDRYKVSVNGGTLHSGPETTDSWHNYQTYDVAKDVHAGLNTVTVEASNTAVGYAGILGKLVVKTSAGDFEVVTDGSWSSSVASDSPQYTPALVLGDFGMQPWGRISAQGATDRTPPPYFRKAFDVKKKVRRATLYATALGIYELSLNGKSVSDDVLSPGWTDFHKRAHYNAYDVTNMVKGGRNALGAILGDGWYASYLAFTGKHHWYGGEPKLMAQLRLEYNDGSTDVIGTDASWKTTYGETTYADMLMGCTIDSTKEAKGWNTALFDDSGWKNAVVRESPTIAIEAQTNEPIRPVGQVVARTVKEPKPKVFVYDIGQNLVGYARIKVNGKAGDKITVRCAERLNPDGTLYTTNLRSAKATDTYILKGGPQVLEPRFTFHGFQYIEVTGPEKAIAPGSVVAVVITSDLKPTLAFNSDNPLVDRLVKNIDWGFKGNSLDVPTDCPQRDERAGWMGDAQVFAKTAMFHRDAGAFYTKWLVDVEDGQLENGAYPDVAPSIISAGNAAWEDAGVVCVYRMYEMYGDTEIIKQHWASLNRFMEHLAAVSPNYLRPVGSYGDWLLLDGPQQSVIHGTAYYYRSAYLMGEMASAIGNSDAAYQFRSLAGKIKETFNQNFVGSDGTVADNGKQSQTFYALALDWDMLPEEKRQPAATKLREMLALHGGHLATGFIGTPVLLTGLAHTGHPQAANDLLLTDTYPSWLYQVKLGATTMWERWDGWTPQKGFQDPGMNSFNHYWLGVVGEWIYTGVSGIDTVGAGWSKISIHPHPPTSMKKAHVKYDSIRGPIECGWMKHGKGGFTMNVVVPPNVSATVYVPSTQGAKITESGDAPGSTNGITFLRYEDGATVYLVGGGSYRFEVAGSK